MRLDLRNKAAARLLAGAVLAGALGLPSAQAGEPAPAAGSPWGFNLSTYLWLPGLKGDFSTQSKYQSFNLNFIDIVDKSSRVPLGFMGRLDADYQHFGFYVDGTYMNLKLKPALDRLGNGLDTELGLMDYGLTYRIFGPSLAEMRQWRDKKAPNRLDVYAGARTLWLDNSVSASGPFGWFQPGVSSSKSFTSPLLGGRIIVDLSPRWFALLDGNFGGFGAQNVDFTGSLMGVVGYKTSVFGVPATLEGGYKALKYKVDSGSLSANATLNGPFIGFTGHW